MSSDPYAHRREMSFAEAEGIVKPQQLGLKEVSKELRALLWEIVYHSLKNHEQIDSYRGIYVCEPWRSILYAKHVSRDSRAADEFDDGFKTLSSELKMLFWNGDYIDIFDTLQWILSIKKLTALCQDRGISTCKKPLRISSA